ncbi:hypothetical protein GCM10007358_16560 [Phocicoccus schoeneichii]|uniref:hypothetical protein n=1 Tax=Phocicoccus schoeneichii TaxID=1812261 RepID=UPI00163F8297|nr:hypothetical protein [Jeotgalicoccus schoeneichii]GGH55307.1 hypothetical protein GCM10007358_16560 [Jeotgalicoccus schoeneichii]
MEELNNTVGITLTDIEKEAYVGAYRCDLVAIDEFYARMLNQNVPLFYFDFENYTN